MIVGGIDLGVRKSAYSIFVNGKMTHCADLTVLQHNRNRELSRLAWWTRESLKVCEFIVIEEPLVGRSVRASLQIAQTAGAIMTMFPETRTELVPVSTWKKEVCGKGNADKQFVRKWLEAEHPSYAALCGCNQDRVDAACIGLYGVQLADRSRQLAEL